MTESALVQSWQDEITRLEGKAEAIEQKESPTEDDVAELKRIKGRLSYYRGNIRKAEEQTGLVPSASASVSELPKAVNLAQIVQELDSLDFSFKATEHGGSINIKWERRTVK